MLENHHETGSKLEEARSDIVLETKTSKKRQPDVNHEAVGRQVGGKALTELGAPKRGGSRLRQAGLTRAPASAPDCPLLSQWLSPIPSSSGDPPPPRGFFR